MATKKVDQNHYNKAVIYARYSSDSQREESIEDQIRECQFYAKHMGYDVIKVYSDKALTATTDKRPNFLKMIKDSEKGFFNYIICYKTDRFARNRGDAAKYKRTLKNNGVKVVYAKVTIPNGPEGIILEGVLESIDEYYSANLSQNIRRGQFGNAQKCKTNGVRVFGYDRDENDCYIVNEREAFAVNKVGDMIIDLIPDVEIRKWLKDNGFKNTKGKDFTKSAIYRMSTNRKYIGEYSFGDVVIPGGMPRIMSDEKFYKIQEIRNTRRTKRTHANNYILTNILYCGECGASMFGRCGTSKSHKKHYYYSCANKLKKTCNKDHIKKDLIENTIVDILNSFVFNDDILNDIVDGVMRYQEENIDNSTLNCLKAELKEIDKSIKNIVNAIEKGMFNETMIERMNKLEKDKKELENKILLEEMDNEIVDRDFIMFILKKFKTSKFDTLENKKRLIETFVSKAFLFNDGKLVLTFNYKKNGHLATHEEVIKILESPSVRQISFGGDEGNRTPVQKPPHMKLLQLILSNEFN